MTYIIHGATGAQGGPVAAALVEAGVEVAAPVRQADAYSGPGTAVQIDYSSDDDLSMLYDGAEGVFVHVPMGPPSVQFDFANVVLAALRKAQPGRVVISTSGAEVSSGDSTPLGTLVSGLADTGVSVAVLEPHIFLENLLMPPVLQPAKDAGVLGYPIAADYDVSWVSHLDVAEVALELLITRRDITGVVGVGALPPLKGSALATAFGAYLERDVQFEPLSPDEFEKRAAPVLGPGASAVADFYRARAQFDSDAIEAGRSAQTLLGLEPRSVERWLRDVEA